VAEVGIDNIMFSIDDPFGDNFDGVDFLNNTQLSTEDREKFAHGNVERLLRLSGETQASVDGRESSLQAAMFSFKSKLKAKMARKALSFLVK
jgi:hypothetical protein